ncbi:hypothetical protein AAXB25_14995 [Paenibacillus lautus]|uniref:hypothetical protein n=1 Tax=Paenibacillus lautus TaxID=1401 RepID=UPI003D2BFAA1
MGNGSCEFTEELLGMGFKGTQITRLLDWIVDADTMQELRNFIILNEDVKKTKVLLVHQFVSHMQDKYSFVDSTEFVTKYETAESHEEKEVLVSRLLVGKASSLMLKKVVEQFNNNPSKLSLFYDKVVRYRKMYKPNEIMTLLDTLPI